MVMSDEEDTNVLLNDTCKTNCTTVPPLTACTQWNIKSEHSVSAVSAKSQVLLVSTVSALGGLAFGYDMGIGANMFNHMNETLTLSCVEDHMICITWLIGAVLASFIGGIVIDTCGRRWTIGCTACLLVCGSMLPVLSNLFPLLLLGRLLGGVGGALSAVAHCVYAAEVAEDVHRGRSITVHQLGVAAGLLLSSMAGTCQSAHWWTMAWLAAVPAAIEGLLAVLCLPQSPHFSLLQISHTTHTKRPATCYAISSVAESLLITLMMFFFLQLSGQGSVVPYAERIFVFLGVCSDISPSVTSIVFNTMKLCGVTVSLCVVDRLGRRLTLMVGMSFVVLCAVVLAVLSALSEGTALKVVLGSCGGMVLRGSPTPELMQPQYMPPPFPLLPTPVSLVAAGGCDQPALLSLTPGMHYGVLMVLLAHQLALSMSLGSVSWLLAVELFPAAVRGRAAGLAVCVLWLVDLIMPVTYVHVLYSLSLSSSFVLHSIISLLAGVTVFLCVPETKGQSLHQVAQEVKNVSMKTRLFRNLSGVPCLRGNTWLLQRSYEYRQVSHAIIESTVI